MNIRAVVFDVYGTLLQVGPPPPDADARWQSLFQDFLQAPPPLSRLDFSVACSRCVARHHDAARARGIPWPEVHWPSVVLEILPDLARLSAADQADFHYRQMQIGHTTSMTPEAAETLRSLKEFSACLGIASNAQAYTLRELSEALATHALTLALFEPDLCFWSFEHGFSKPDPHVFQTLSARLAARGISPSEILMVGDTAANDLEPARTHGWETWHLAIAAGNGAGDWRVLLAHLGLGSSAPAA